MSCARFALRLGLIVVATVVASSVLAEDSRISREDRDRRETRGDVEELIAEAIANNTVTPELIEKARDELEDLVTYWDFIGADIAADHLRNFLLGGGNSISYGSNSEIAQNAKSYGGAIFSHEAAHRHTQTAILEYIKRQIEAGQTSFPSTISLSQLDFSVTKGGRLQGPTFYEKGLLFRVPLLSPDKIDLMAGFGDMSGPHNGLILNLKVKIRETDSGDIEFDYDYHVAYEWKDNYTFKNDKDMSSWDAAAYYLENVAKVTKPFTTAINLTEPVKGKSRFTPNKPPSPPASGTPEPGNGSGPSSRTTSNPPLPPVPRLTAPAWFEQHD